jgi:hypothetical protein
VAAVDRRRLRSHRHAGDCSPGGKCLTAGGMKPGGAVVVWAVGEEVGDLIMDGKKPLHLPRRFEPFHDPLSSSGRLVGILCAVVEAFVLAVLDARQDIALGGGIAFQLVGDQHTRDSSLLLQQFAQQALGRLLIAPALDENVKDKPLLVNGAPEPMLCAGDGDDDLIKVPFALSWQFWASL